ncbi:raffinose/stachyose/melibiose transport system permease protein [Paenibacillus tianmuensis]|uniref:Raffinose/stachyose/melibiose transport system permease protein n=1 Tax=Paenibacillus tianmuensis TaxID=624147 RepID=A0A1G4TCC0_9BACL|nr:sugar ABC transporter permease [Paenibacillus tianmuensis]SCW79094.1 raffinose/stachyose/melibiose transport system permease protein [Paenibacillus tianmuensis]
MNEPFRTVGTSLRRGKKRSSAHGKTRRIAYLFVLPALLMTLLFDYYPILDGMYHAFYRWDGAALKKFVGFGNFAEIVADSVFWISVRNMAILFMFHIVLMIPTLAACIVLFRLRSAASQYVYRILFCLPMVVPGLVTLLLWQFMYNPQFGFFNQLLTLVGWGQYRQLWLGDPDLALGWLIFMGFPWIGTIAALIYLGGLQSVDSSIWDAAKMDGVGPVAQALKIELPLLKGHFKLNLIGVISGTITGYGTQLVMTGGGPGYATLVPGLYMYQKAFGGNTEFGYASAVGLLLFMIALVISIAAMKFIKSE